MAPPRGTPKPPGSGRKPGSRNKAHGEVRAIARAFVDDERYRAALMERLVNGEAGSMESLLWQLAYGKPTATSADGQLMPTKITVEF